MKGSYTFIFLISCFLISILSMSLVNAQATNVSILHGWNGTEYVPLEVDSEGKLKTTLNLNELTSINPDADNIRSIGTSSLRWLNLFLSGNLYGNGTAYFNSLNATDDVCITGGNCLSTSISSSLSWSEVTNGTLYLSSNPFGFYNSTDFNIDDYYLASNPFGFYNATDFDIGDYRTLTNLTFVGNGSFTTDVCIEGGTCLSAAGTDSLSWSEVTNGTLYLASNPFGFYNITDFDIDDYYLESNPFSFVNTTTASDLNNLVILSGANITDDGTYLLATGDTATGNYTFDTSTLFIDSSNDRVGIGTSNPQTIFDIDTNSNTAGLRVRGAAESAEIADIYLRDSGALTFDLTPGSDTDQYIDFKPEDDNYGIILRESDGTGDTPYANFYVTDATDDYLSINVNSVTDGDALVVAESNKVGIGTATPSYKLDVSGDILTSGWFRSNDAAEGLYNENTGGYSYSESANYWTTVSSNGMIFRNAHAGTVTGYVYWDGTAGSNNFGLLSPSGNWRVRTDNTGVELYGPVTVGSTSDPGLTVGNGATGYVDIGSSGWYDDGTYFSPSGSRAFYIRNTIGTTYIYSGSIYLGSTSGTNVFLRGNTMSGNGWSLTGAGKLNVATIDPPYTINENPYATYMAGMIGLKEEVTGLLRLEEYSEKDKSFKHVIDFNNQEEGSDLWLFGKTINLDAKTYVDESGNEYLTTKEEVFDNLVVMLSPNFNGQVWYEKLPEEKKLIIYGSKQGEVSYRFTGERFDGLSVDNTRNPNEEGFIEGFNLDKLLK